MSPAALERLKTVARFVNDELAAGATPEAAIAGMIAQHHAVHRYRYGTYELRASGVAGTCTSCPGKGVLDSWRKNATVRLMRERMA